MLYRRLGKLHEIQDTSSVFTKPTGATSGGSEESGGERGRNNYPEKHANGAETLQQVTQDQCLFSNYKMSM